jgi:hypothetical protein
MNDAPLMWAKKLDLVPVLGTQVLIGNGRLEVRQMNFEIREPERPPLFVGGKAYLKLEDGIVLKHVPGSPSAVCGSFGSDDPRNEVVPVPQKELCDDLNNYMGGIQDISIVDRMNVMPVPKGAVKVNPVLEEIDDLWIAETRRGSKKEFTTAAGPVRLASYSKMVKAKCLEMDVPPVLSKNIRSGMLSKYIIGNDGKLGWTDVLRNPGISGEIIGTLTEGWWEDTAIPEHVYSHSSGTVTSTINRSDVLVKLKKSGVNACFTWENESKGE